MIVIVDSMLNLGSIKILKFIFSTTFQISSISVKKYLILSVPCRWSSWGRWSSCSRSCGRGVKSRSRRIVRHARHGGRKCYGSSRVRSSCYRRRTCPICRNRKSSRYCRRKRRRGWCRRRSKRSRMWSRCRKTCFRCNRRTYYRRRYYGLIL